jgi:ring-1,2-phenylacetyl-CoA epoxidase subunit PaaA
MYIDQTVPQAHYLGLTIPDPDLSFDEETGHWSVGPIDWDEFWATIKGDGRLNRERIAHKVKAWDDGQWVRDAATAYADKHAQRLGKSA